MFCVETTVVEWIKRDFKMAKKTQNKKQTNKKTKEMPTARTVCRGGSEIEYISAWVTQEQDKLVRRS